MNGNHIDRRSMRIVSFDTCPYCGLGDIKRNGHTRSGIQRFRCNQCHRTFTGRVNTILFSSKLRPQQLRTLLSMLMDGATVRQACHQAGVSYRTGMLYLRKIDKLFENQQERTISGDIWADEAYLNCSMAEFEYSPRPAKSGKRKKKAGISSNKVMICCGIKADDSCFAVEAGKEKGMVQAVYERMIQTGSNVTHDEGRKNILGSMFELTSVNSKSEDAHRMLNPINRFINVVQRWFKVHLRIRRSNIQKRLNFVCYMYENREKGFENIWKAISERIFTSSKMLRRRDVSMISATL